MLVITGLLWAGLQLTGIMRVDAVLTGSMAVPDGIPVGSWVIGMRTPEVLLGEVVSGTRTDGKHVVHRVVEVLDESHFLMKGDANRAVDAVPYVNRRSSTYRVFAVVPRAGRLATDIRDNPFALVGATVVCLLLVRPKRRWHSRSAPGRHRSAVSAI